MEGVKTPVVLYAVLCAILWMLPLLQILHAESSAVIAFASFFIAGLSALQLFQLKRAFPYVWGLQSLLLLIPLGMMSMSMLWIPNCEFPQGLLYFLLFPPITVFFSVSLAFAVDSSSVRPKRVVFIVIGILISLLGPLYDIGFHSQFFTYNHVFGGVMGPIYDEELPIRHGLVFFRGLTILWALFFLLSALRIRRRGRDNKWVVSGWVCALVLIGACYLFSAPLRINSPAWYIQDQLGGHLETENFDIYYDPDHVSETQLQAIRDEHEYRYQVFKQKLGIEVEQSIQSYIYPDPDVKDWLTGSRTTSVSPVWLRVPQLHMYMDVFDRVFAHELAHVFSREFGLPFINASLSVGLVEGFAVALEPSDGRPFPHEQIVTAMALHDIRGDHQSTIGQRLRGQLSPVGFWTGRGAVSYTTMGSFVRFLIDTYGYDSFFKVYAFSNFEDVYGIPIETLVRQWEAHLSGLPYISRSTYGYVTRRFAVPSLFEQRCPHHVPPYERNYRSAVEALAVADTAEALRKLEKSLRIAPAFQESIDAWARIYLSKGQADSVSYRISQTFSGDSTRFMTPGLWVRLGDAYTFSGNQQEARTAYDTAMERVPLYAHEQRGLIALRNVLNGSPEVIAILVSGTPPEEKKRQLDTYLSSGNEKDVADHILLLLQALLLMAADNVEAAIPILESISEEQTDEDHWVLTGEAKKIYRLFRIARLSAYYEGGHLEKALAEATHIEQDLERIGAIPEARQYADFADKMRYIIQRRNNILSIP